MYNTTNCLFRIGSENDIWSHLNFTYIDNYVCMMSPMVPSVGDTCVELHSLQLSVLFMLTSHITYVNQITILWGKLSKWSYRLFVDDILLFNQATVFKLIVIIRSIFHNLQNHFGLCIKNVFFTRPLAGLQCD